MILLTRDNFRNSCLIRDDNKCVICKVPHNLSVHHIIERRLFGDGGYYMNNGASLCEKHHIMAEETTLSCDEIREACGITKICLPDHFYSDNEYDKWGNIILANGQRIKGELFYDESVQKILKQGKVLDLFQKYVKYSRTYHLPWSNLLKDDRMLPDDSNFTGKRVIMTLKMDGENTTWYNDYIHARSLDGNSHPSRNWVKGLWAQKKYLLDDNMRICGENMYAKHSIEYNDLESYFYMFSFWIENICLSWDETVEYSKILDLSLVPVVYDGIYDKNLIIKAFEPYKNKHEGYVVRIADSFEYGSFRKSIAKFVRPEFRQIVNNSHGHWISKKIEPNKLKVV
jgi:hypothetical protein